MALSAENVTPTTPVPGHAGGGKPGPAPLALADSIFIKIAAVLESEEGKKKTKNKDKVLMYKFADTGNSWVIDIAQSKAYKGSSKADCTIVMKNEHLFAQLIATRAFSWFKGKKDLMDMYLDGDVQVEGDEGAALKVGEILKDLGARAQEGDGAKKQEKAGNAGLPHDPTL